MAIVVVVDDGGIDDGGRVVDVHAGEPAWVTRIQNLILKKLTFFSWNFLVIFLNYRFLRIS